MPKVAKKYYAVAVGREGPKIYDTWDECKAQTTKYPSVFKSFPSLQQAEQWLVGKIDLRGSNHTSSNTQNIQAASTVSPSQNSNLSTRDEALPFAGPLPSHSTPPSSFPEQQQPIEDNFKPLAPRPSVTLSPEQQQVLDRVNNGQSVFFTGSAGTGKSVLLREIIASLKERGDRVAITASTGIAAVNIGGSTLHSWAGIGLAEEAVERYVGKFLHNKQLFKVLERWQNVTTLIIDEVSMVDGSLFDKLEAMARGLRRNEHPFGGIQLVLSGDFCQLPPVPSRDKNGRQIPPIFAFNAETWEVCVGSPVMLTRVFRQKEQNFVDILNALRFGELDSQAVATFSALSRKVDYVDGIEPTELFPTRYEVDNANNSRLGQLQTETHLYNANDIPGKDSNGNRVTMLRMGNLLNHLVVPKQIYLKVGAQVMLVKNLIQGQLVNGSVGQIVRFVTAQGAISEGTHIPGVDRVEGRQKLPPGDFVWPIVRFIGGQETLIVPQDFTVNNADGEMEARRNQVPLILSWALSIHKSQGQTLERVKVDLRRIFEDGQAYVALSRATRMDQLQILNFDPSKVTAHSKVIEWHQSYSKNHQDNEIIELSDSDDDTMTAPAGASEEVIDLTETSGDEVDEELAKSLYHDM